MKAPRTLLALLLVTLMSVPPIPGVFGQGLDDVPPVIGEDSEFPDSPGEGFDAVAGTLDYATGIPENEGSPIYRIYHEGFEGSCSGLPDGWGETVLPGGKSGWHRDCYSAHDFSQGEETAIIHTGKSSLSIRRTEGDYPAGIDSRATTPVIDLRHVGGASIDTNAATNTEDCSGLVFADDTTNASTDGNVDAAATARELCESQFADTSLHDHVAELKALFADLAENGDTWWKRSLGEAGLGTPDDVSDLPLTEERYGSGLVNLSFWHYWDFTEDDENGADDGGMVEVRWERDDGTWSDWTPLAGDLVFETNVSWADAIQATGCKPWLAYQTGGTGGDGLSDLTPAICQGYNFYDDAIVDGADTSGVGASLSALYANHVEGRPATGPNGRVDTDQDPHTHDPPGYVKSSGTLVYTTYTLNRFIGHRVQVGFHAVSAAETQTAVDGRGWFIDDLQVTALLPSRDVGIHEVLMPQHGDTVNVNHNAVMPKVVVKNYGRSPVDRVNVTFQFVSADGTGYESGKFYAPSRNLALGALESAVVSPTRPWLPTEAGAGEGLYTLLVDVRIDPVVGSDGYQGIPEDDVNKDNNHVAATFRAGDVQHALVDLDVNQASVLTDVDEPKDLTITVRNVGNMNLTGLLCVRYRATDTSVSPPAPVGDATDITTETFAGGTALPFGRTITSTGYDGSDRVIAATWNTQGLAPGVYFLNASFYPANELTKDGGCPTTARGVLHYSTTYAFVRSTRAAGLVESFALPGVGSPYPDRAIEAIQWVAGSFPKWYPQAYHTGHADFFESQFVPMGPTVPQGYGVWMAHGSDCRQTDTNQGTQAKDCVAGSTNLADWHVLRRDITAPPDATSLRVSFLSQGFFTWDRPLVPETDESGHNFTRGLVRIMPQDTEWFQDYLQSQGGDKVAQTIGGTEVTLVDHERLVTEDGVSIEEKTYRVGNETVDVTILYLQDPHTWRRYTTTVDIERFGTTELAVEWVLESTPERLAAYQNDGDAWCQTGPTSTVTAVTCPAVAESLINHWYLDDISIELLADGTPLADETFEAGGETAASQEGFRDCTDKGSGLETFNRETQPPFCRGWGVEILPTRYPSNWYIETLSDADLPPTGSREALRFGFLTNDLQAPDQGYGGSHTGDGRLTLSTLQTPEFGLEGYREPVLTFWTKHAFDDGTTVWFKANDGGEPRYHDGGSVWLVVEDADGSVIARDILTPEGGYNGRLYVEPYVDPAPTPENDNSDKSPYPHRRMHHHPDGAIYDATPGNNIFAAASNPDANGDPQWMQVTVSLEDYVALFADPDVRFRIEFQAIVQSNPRDSAYFQQTTCGGPCYWRIDDVRVEDRAAANDVALKSLDAPAPGRDLGPGLTQVIRATVENTGLYPQTDVVLNYTVLDANMNPLLNAGGAWVTDEILVADEGTALPGLLSDDPERTLTDSFGTPWVPPETDQAQYFIRVRADLRTYEDTNPGNNEIIVPFTVVERHAVGIRSAAEVGDDEVVTPVIGGIGDTRTFRVPVVNLGTMPEDFDGEALGDLGVRLVVRSEVGDILVDRERAIPGLPVGASTTVVFEDAWVPQASGLYIVEFHLIIPDGLEGTGQGVDNLRTLKVMVFNNIVPAQNELWKDAFVGAEPWYKSTTSTDGLGWSFQGPDGAPYPNLANGTLDLTEAANFRSIRNLFLTVEHRYDLEEGYDGGLVEVSPDGGKTWYIVPPKDGYPGVMTGGSPLVEDPFNPPHAITGVQSDYVTWDFNLGAVDALQRIVPLREESFDVALPDATTDHLAVSPRGGDDDGMWFSDKYAVKCDRVYRVITHTWNAALEQWSQTSDNVPHTISFPVMGWQAPSPYPQEDPKDFGAEYCGADWDHVFNEHVVPDADGGPFKKYEYQLWTQNLQAYPYLDSVKTLRAPLDLTGLPPEDTALEVSFWDWRAIGSTVRIDGDKSRQPIQSPNGIEVNIVYGSESVPLLVYDRSGNFDRYRDWTRNTYVVPADEMEKVLAHVGPVYLEFAHHIATGLPFADLGGGHVQQSSPADSDWQSPHFGWAIDDVRVAASFPGSLPGGQEILSVTDPSDATDWETAHATTCLDRTRVTESDCSTGASRESGSGKASWRAEGTLTFGDVWSVSPVTTPSGASLAPGHTRTLLVARPPDQGVGGLSGADERLELALDLKSAVDAVTLTFDTEYKFTTYVTYDNLGKAVPYPASGGRVEVSTDAGRTWTPLSPVDGENGVAEGVTFCQQSSTATHTPLAGRTADPQANSGFGLCGTSLMGRTGSYHEDLFFGFKGEATYDLSEFAGKDVLLGFRAFFTTNREVLGEAVTSPVRGGDAWYIDNLTVTAAVLDVRDAQIRLRGAADGSVAGDGWDVRDLRLLGVKHAHNVALTVPPITETGYVPKGVTPFTVELINKGQLDAEDILLHVWVNATRPDGTRALAPYTVEYAGPLSMFDVCPSSLDAPDGDGLAAETNTYLCGFGGALMEFHADTGYVYEITARAAHANLAHDPLYADDVATRTLTPDRILSDPVIRVKEMTIAPNVLEAGSDDVADVTVVLENFGATRASIKSFTLVVEGTAIRIVGSDCASDGSTVLEEPLETRTFRCEVAAGDFTSGGVFVANVTVVTDGAGEPTRSETRVLYVGSSLLADLGFDDHVEREYEFAVNDPEHWYESNNANNCLTTPAPWTITEKNDRTYWNNTWYHSFILPKQNNAQGGEDTPPEDFCGKGTPKGYMHNELTSPLIPVDHFEGPDGEPSIWLTFYSRHAFTGNSFGTVSVSLWDKAANQEACNDPIEVHTITGRSTDYVRGRYHPITVDIGGALQRAKEDGMGCIDSPNFPWDHVALHFKGWDKLDNEWQIDDISVAPIGAAIGPPTRATAEDDTDKRYRLVLENRGGYSDGFRIHLTDDEGGKAAVPSGWHIVVLDDAGHVVWPPEAQYTPAPDACSDIEEPRFTDAVELDAGEAGVLEAKVCIPISESQTGRSGDVELGITAQSLANPFHNVTAPLIVSYEYALRPNLVIPANGVTIDNPDLPVDQPRTVTVTVVNVGPLDAEDVVIQIEDLADDSTDRPTVLRGVNGDAVAPIANVPIGESVTRTFLWTPTVTGWHNLSVAVDPKDTIRELRESDNAKRIPLFITKPEFPDLVVDVTPQTSEPGGGTPIWVDMAITNVGGKTATGVQLTLKAGVTDLLIHEGSRADDLIVRIDPGETVHVNKTWVPAFPGNITLIAGALPRFGILERVETQDDNYDIVSVLVRSQGLRLDAEATSLEAELGESVSLDLTVGNFGETVDTYAINVQVPPGVQAVVYDGGTRASTIDLESGENATLTVTFTLPHAMAAGAYDIAIEGVSKLAGGGTSGARDTLDVVLHVAPVHDLSVEAPLQRLTPGRHVIPVALINDGNAEEAVTLTAPRLPDGWTSEAGTGDVAPYGTGTANMTLVLPGDTPAGIYEVFMVADTPDGPLANGTLLVEVLEHEVLRATVVGETSGVRAGRILDLSLDVVNDGNVRGEAALNVTVPDGWTKVLGRSLVALEPSERLSVPLTLVVPEDAEPEKYPVTVDVIGLEATRTTRTNLTVAESDLEIIDFVFTPRVNVEPGTVMTFNATVLNSGLPARDVTVAFYVDDFLLGVQAIPLVGRDNTTDVGFRWVAQPGEHVILVIVDPEDRFREDDEANNARLEVVTTTGEVGILGAARQAVPGAGAALAVVTLAGAALWAARRTRT